MKRLLLVLLLLPLSAALAADPKEIFERRILPIFRSPNPSSCTECHLAGVDLKNYILPSHEKTFLSLRDQGLVDLENPADSKILRLIAMGGGTNQGAALISAKVREAELAAFADWIQASARDPKLRSAARLSVAEHGEQVSWMRDTADATMRYPLDSENLNVKQPERSRLLLKPLNEIKHGGGQKMLPGDMTYKAFRAWLDDYSKTVNDRYTSAAELPRSKSGPEMFGTEIWLKLNNTPPEWGERLLQVTVFVWDKSKNSWESEPIAISDRGVWGSGTFPIPKAEGVLHRPRTAPLRVRNLPTVVSAQPVPEIVCQPDVEAVWTGP